MESYHAYVTHPQLMPFTGDANAAYHVLGDHVNVNYTPFGIVSPHVETAHLPQQWIVDEFRKYNGRSADNYDPEKDSYNIQVPEGQTARGALGAAMRQTSAQMFGGDYSAVSEAELLDALVFNVFPNFAPWGGFMPNIVYRWRPGKTPDTCLMEVRVLARVKQGEPIPRGVPMHLLGPDEKWTSAAELGGLGPVFEQDMDNLPFVQQGLHCSKNGQVQLADYQEIRIRHFHRTMNKYLSGELGQQA
jgi:hypothetical protein